MFKDYYLILGVNYDASAADIKSAYRAKSMRWHPDRNPDRDVTHVMQEINEAYAILGNAEKRQRYDLEYLRYRATSDAWKVDEFVVQDETVAEDIKQARQSAQELVAEFMKSFKHTAKVAAKGAGEASRGYVFALIVMFVLGLLLAPYWKQEVTQTETDIKTNDIEPAAALVATEEQPSPFSNVASTAAAWQPPTSWKRYEFGNGACSIAVPSTVELRQESDAYTQRSQIGGSYSPNAAVFQQKGLSSNSAAAFKHYCRIIVQYAAGRAGDFLRATDTTPIDRDERAVLREMVLDQLGSYNLLNEPTYRWIDIQGIKALEIKYRRSGDQNNTTSVAMYLLWNYSEIAQVTVAYRESERNLWMPDMGNVIRTFRWE